MPRVKILGCMLGVQFPAFQSSTVPKAENESSTTQHCRNYIPSDTEPQPQVRKSAATLLWEPQTFQHKHGHHTAISRSPHCHWKPHMLHAISLPCICPSHTTLIVCTYTAVSIMLLNLMTAYHFTSQWTIFSFPNMDHGQCDGLKSTCLWIKCVHLILMDHGQCDRIKSTCLWIKCVHLILMDHGQCDRIKSTCLWIKCVHLIILFILACGTTDFFSTSHILKTWWCSGN